MRRHRAGCFTMALTAALSRARIRPTRIHTRATVALEKVARDAKQNCPVSMALARTEIRLDARLL